MIVIVGTTGVGKSKLAVELAQALASSDDASSSSNHPSPSPTTWTRARVLNADAMQVYRGLDIITNKIPLEEQNGVEHCLMGFKEPGEQYVVGEWIGDALKVVSTEFSSHDPALVQKVEIPSDRLKNPIENVSCPLSQVELSTGYNTLYSLTALHHLMVYKRHPI